MLLNKRRAPFGWGTMITEKFLNVGQERAGVGKKRSQLDLPPACRRHETIFYGLTHCHAQVRPKWRQPFE
jgi:hypothetical protein